LRPKNIRPQGGLLQGRDRVSVCRTFICREQMKSEQGCLERVLQTGTRFLPLARPDSTEMHHLNVARLTKPVIPPSILLK